MTFFFLLVSVRDVANDLPAAPFFGESLEILGTTNLSQYIKKITPFRGRYATGCCVLLFVYFGTSPVQDGPHSNHMRTKSQREERGGILFGAIDADSASRNLLPPSSSLMRRESARIHRWVNGRERMMHPMAFGCLQTAPHIVTRGCHQCFRTVPSTNGGGRPQNSGCHRPLS